MKVFISWSGERSRLVAELLNNWLKCVLQALEPWISSNIDRGASWFPEITTALNNTANGIICLTTENINEPWILFEAGALATGITNPRVCTFLIDLKPEDVKDPLAQFNHTLPDRESMKKLINTLNSRLQENALIEPVLNNVFETYWPQFECDFQKIIEHTQSSAPKRKQRGEADILSELLFSVRNMDRRMRTIEQYREIQLDSRSGKQISFIDQEKDFIRPPRNIMVHEFKNLMDNGLDEKTALVKLSQQYRLPLSVIERIIRDCREIVCADNQIMEKVE